MIDLHCHLLPGVDDGPATLAESLALCRIAVADGITHSIVTPHIHPGRWDNTKNTIERGCKALQISLDEAGIELKLGFAAEVRLSDQIMQQIEDDEIPFYGEVDGYNIMLLEFPHGHIIPGSEKLVAWLMDRKIRPLIAHPERNRAVMREVEVIRPFVELGCLLQITGGSLLGSFGDQAEVVANDLLGRGWVDVVASDGHNCGARRPELSGAFECVSQILGNSVEQRFTLPAVVSSLQTMHTDVRFHACFVGKTGQE